MKRKKILCVCSAGLVRSAALKDGIFWGWNQMDVINCGVDGNGDDTLDMLYKWADVILVVADNILPFIPQEFRSKTKVVPIGEDEYGNPGSLELKRKVESLLVTCAVMEDELEHYEILYTPGTQCPEHLDETIMDCGHCGIYWADDICLVCGE